MTRRATTMLVPALVLAAVATLAATLILQIVWRPWADPDRSWSTHLNLETAVPEGYSRTVAAYVGERGPLAAWGLNSAAVVPAEQEGRALYIAYGCASCHGLDAGGAIFAADLPGHSATKVIKGVRSPLGQMPAFSTADISDQELELIAAYIASLGPVQEEPEFILMGETQLTLYRSVLEALKAGNTEEAKTQLVQFAEATEDHEQKHQVEELLEMVGAGKLHDAEHMLEAMLEGQPEPSQDMPETHLRQALKALEDRELDMVAQHLEEFIAVAQGMDRIKTQTALDLFNAKEYHDAGHGIEELLGMDTGH